MTRIKITDITDTEPHRAAMDALYAGLSGREQPEDVAARIAPLLRDRLDARERSAFGRGLPGRRRTAAYNAYGAASPYGYAYADIFEDEDNLFGASADSSMSTKFDGVTPLNRQAQILAEIAGFVGNFDFDRNTGALDALLAFARAQIHMAPGHTDFKADRLNGDARYARGMRISRRRYDKLFRLIRDLETLRAERTNQAALFALGRFAKTVFAADLARERFGRDLASACFVAYLTANLGRRSLFTNGHQAGAFDERAAALFALLERSATTDWYAVAHVFPRADVLDRVSLEDRTTLLARVLDILTATATRLEAAATTGDINTTTMIVARGNDSSTWNALAGAWNKARDYWIGLVYSLGQEAMFESFLPGKTLRLMAADVASWHRATDGDLHDDTPIWAALPKPWEVLAGTAACGRAQIEAVCRSLGVDPTKTGWSAPRPRTSIDVTRPTPETVHGVVVGHPALAAFLRKIDAFGGHGHPLRWDRLPETQMSYATARSSSSPYGA